MGFVTGFTGGVTLTLGLAYLTVLSHERNRQSQAIYLRSQSQLLNSLLDPTPIPPASRAELARQSRNTFTETAKDRWNDEIENAVRWIQTTDWHGVREGMEGAVARALGLGLQKSRESVGAEKKAGLNIQEAADRSKAAARQGAENASGGVDRATETAKEGAIEGAAAIKGGLKDASIKAKDLASATKASVSKAVSGAKSGVDSAAGSTRGAIERGVEKVEGIADRAGTDISNLNAGTVDAARGAVRNVISKGIEKGKEVIGKAQEAVGLATERVEISSKTASLNPRLSPTEKALRERYEKPHGLDKTAEQALEERYKPIDERDNTILRGV